MGDIWTKRLIIINQLQYRSNTDPNSNKPFKSFNLFCLGRQFNARKQIQKVQQNEETEEYAPNKRVRQNSRKRTK